MKNKTKERAIERERLSKFGDSLFSGRYLTNAQLSAYSSTHLFENEDITNQ
jgi:hypothetical protein